MHPSDSCNEPLESVLEQQQEFQELLAAVAIESAGNPEIQSWNEKAWQAWLSDNSFDIDTIKAALLQLYTESDNAPGFDELVNALANNPDQSLSEQIKGLIIKGDPVQQFIQSKFLIEQETIANLEATAGGGNGVKWMCHHPWADVGTGAGIVAAGLLGRNYHLNTKALKEISIDYMQGSSTGEAKLIEAGKLGYNSEGKIVLTNKGGGKIEIKTPWKVDFENLVRRDPPQHMNVFENPNKPYDSDSRRIQSGFSQNSDGGNEDHDPTDLLERVKNVAYDNGFFDANNRTTRLLDTRFTTLLEQSGIRYSGRDSLGMKTSIRNSKWAETAKKLNTKAADTALERKQETLTSAEKQEESQLITNAEGKNQINNNINPDSGKTEAGQGLPKLKLQPETPGGLNRGYMEEITNVPQHEEQRLEHDAGRMADGLEGDVRQEADNIETAEIDTQEHVDSAFADM